MKNASILLVAIALLSAAAPPSVGAEMPPDTSAVPQTRPSGKGDRVFEIRAGILLHDRALFHDRKERGEDLNFEALLPPPAWKVFKAIWSPRPHVGVNVNDHGDTSQVYGGFTWEWRPFRNAFVDGSLGLSLHDGDLSPGRRGLEGLGLRVLFRESLDVGYRFGGRHGFSLHVEHVSNAGLAPENQGISSMGARYGYRY